jgi:SAM-dependent methyltransferase
VWPARSGGRGDAFSNRLRYNQLNSFRKQPELELYRGVTTMIGPKSSDVEMSYDVVADEYAQRIFEELKHKPVDRNLLDRFAARVRTNGPACDLGCGPGHVARYLHERGVQIIGVDLSPVMVGCAKRLNPGIEFRQGDTRRLDVEDGSWGGIVAFYSIIHIPRSEVVAALSEMKRVLRPGGELLLSFHIGDDILHLDEWWGHAVSVDFIFFRTDEMRELLGSAGFQVGDIVEREPYPGVEHQSQRAYIFAQKPRGSS